jgi:hypothetical protein
VRDPIRRSLLRLAAGVVILLALGGPTPGYIGSCDAGGARVADPAQFCVDKRSAECARDLSAMRITMEMYNACSATLLSECNGFNWAAGCSPSPETADACLAALRDPSRLGTLNSEIVECNAASLCGAAPLVSDDGI